MENYTSLSKYVIVKKRARRNPGNNTQGGDKVKKDFTCKLSPGEKKFAKTLYSRWTEKEIVSGHRDDLCKTGGCKPIALKTLTKRGFLENKGDYYRIISKRFEEL